MFPIRSLLYRPRPLLMQIPLIYCCVLARNQDYFIGESPHHLFPLESIPRFAIIVVSSSEMAVAVVDDWQEVDWKRETGVKIIPTYLSYYCALWRRERNHKWCHPPTRNPRNCGGSRNHFSFRVRRGGKYPQGDSKFSSLITKKVSLSLPPFTLFHLWSTIAIITPGAWLRGDNS